MALPAPSQAAVALVPATEVLYEMNEPDGATVMLDSSGNGVNAPINQAGLDTGVAFGGAIGYSWAYTPPAAPPAYPERVIQVADNPRLDPRGDTFTVEIRFRTTRKFGNIIQKGQSASKGGQWKIQNPKGMPSCLFKDGTGRTAGIQSKVALNDNTWHTLTCVRTTTSVTMYVDGAYMNRKNGTTGTIDNTIPMTIGGKINCDQVEITCDYYTGMIDYVKLTRGT
jgi:hypothetical protein